MVQISGDLDPVTDVLVHVASRLRAILIDRVRAFTSFVQVLPYLLKVLNYASRVLKIHGHGHSYSKRYGDSYDLSPDDGYKSYGGLQGRSSGDAYGGSSR